MSDVVESVLFLLRTHTELFVSIGLCMSALWSLVCRVNFMQAGVTRPVVYLQHIALGVAILVYLLFPVGPVVLLGGITVFLLMGSHRWKSGAPEGTQCAPRYLTSDEARQAAGGQK